MAVLIIIIIEVGRSERGLFACPIDLASIPPAPSSPPSGFALSRVRSELACPTAKCPRCAGAFLMVAHRLSGL